MAKKIFFLFIGFCVLLFFWLKSFHFAWVPADKLQQVSKFQYLQQNSQGTFQTDVESYKASQKCFGFEGQCAFPELGVEMSLSFDGFQFNKPGYVLFNMWGGSTGWQKSKTFFGTRTLKISTFNQQKSSKFTQFIWNDSSYSDFSQILYFDFKNRKIIVTARDGFMGVNEIGYAVEF